MVSPVKAKDYEGTSIEVDGKDYPVDNSWSEAQIQAYANGIVQQNRARAQAKAAPAVAPQRPQQAAPAAPGGTTPASPAPLGNRPQGGGFLGTAGDLVKQGFNDLSGTLHGAGAVLDNMFSVPGSLTAEQTKPLGEVYRDASTKARASSADFTGTKGYTSGSSIVDAGVKSIGDTTNLVGGPAKTITMKAAAPLVMSLMGHVLGNTAAAAGAEGARGVAEQAGYGTGGQLGASLVGGTAAGLTPSVVAAKMAPSLVQKAWERFGPMLNPKAAAGEVDRRVSAKVQKQLEAKVAAMHAEDPGLAARLEAQTAASRGMGIADPLLSQVAADNGIVKSMTAEAGANPQFRRGFEERRAKGLETTQAAADNTFGTRPDAEGTLAGLTSKAAAQAPAVESRLESLAAKRKALAEDLMGSDLTRPIELGHKIKALDDATEQAAREQASVKYKEATEGAIKRGEALVDAENPALKQFIAAVDDPVGADMFKHVPGVKAMVEKIKGRISAADGGAILTAAEADGLKQAVAQAVRGMPQVDNANALRYANQILDLVKGSKEGAPGILDAVSPAFAQSIREADTHFARTVAGPFGDASAKALSKPEFAAQVVSRVLSNNEAALAFIKRNDAVGDHAKGLAQDALLYDLSRRQTKRGLTPEVLAEWKAKHKEVIEASGLADKVKTFEDTQHSLLAAEANLQSNFDSAVKADILAGKVDGKVVTKEMNPDQFVQQVRRDPRMLAKFLHGYRDSGGAKAVQSIYLDSLLSSPNPGKTMADDMKRNPQLRALMGPYQKRVDTLVERMEQLGQKLEGTADPQRLIPKDAADRVTGVSYPEMAAKLAERIGAVTTKAFALVRKGTATRTERALIEEQGHLLLDNDRVVAMLKAAESGLKSEDPEHMKKALDIAMDLARKGGRGTQELVQGAANKGAMQGTKAFLNDAGTAEDQQIDSNALTNNLRSTAQ